MGKNIWNDNGRQCSRIIQRQESSVQSPYQVPVFKYLGHIVVERQNMKQKILRAAKRWIFCKRQLHKEYYTQNTMPS